MIRISLLYVSTFCRGSSCSQGVSLPLDPPRDQTLFSSGAERDGLGDLESCLSTVSGLSPPESRRMMTTGELPRLLELSTPPTLPMALGARDLALGGVSAVSLKLDTRRMLITFFISLRAELCAPASPTEGFLLAKELALLMTVPWFLRGSGQ